MLKIYLTIFIVIVFNIPVLTQGTPYFNNIYNHENGITTGLSIIEIENGYAGYGATINNSSIGQKLVFIKINLSGEEIIWEQYGNDYQTYYPGNVGGALIKTIDNKLALAYHTDFEGVAYSSLIKLDYNFDTLWKKDYTTDNLWTMTMNTLQTDDFGFLLTGSVKPAEGEYWDFLIIKTDSFGNMEWYQTYGGVWSEHGEKTVQTPDGGYLIGGYFWKPGYDHSLDAMVIKTDNLGNEEWTQYYGNPDVDDDMALVAMADDGNYLVATVYGEWIIAPEARTGRMYIVKVDQEGNTVWDIKIGPKMYASYVKNLRYTQDGNLIASGFFMDDTTSDYIYKGFLYKFTQEGDSIWMRDYNHFNNQYDRNFFYDASPTSDNGYIAIGKARPDGGGQTNKMWVVKVDSMGCDTPGCITTVISEELFVNSREGLLVWPNPTKSKFEVWSSKFEVAGNKIIRVYNSQGLKVEEIKIPEGIESMEVDVSIYTNGLYYLQYIHANQIVETVKFIKN